MYLYIVFVFSFMLTWTTCLLQNRAYMCTVPIFEAGQARFPSPCVCKGFVSDSAYILSGGQS